MWNGGVQGDVPGVLSDVDLITELAPEYPRLGGDVLTGGARHVQAVHHGIALAILRGAALLRGHIVRPGFKGTQYVRGEPLAFRLQCASDLTRVLLFRVGSPFPTGLTNSRVG